MPRHETLKQIARLAPVRLLKMAITLVVIAFLAQFLLIMADRGRNGLPAAPETALVEAISQTAGYVFEHPDTYYLRKANLPTAEVVLDAFSKSVGLLLFSLSLGTLIGVPLGVTMALSRRNISRVLIVLTSVLLTSIPSFLLAMLLWIINIQAHQRLNTPQLPITGFGWDAHIILPALVLMARPLAQIAQVTYVTLQDVMQQDFVRVAYAKGFSRLSVVNRHALKNTAIPVMTTLGASLRFSLASLPVVEAFFLWPGVGLLLLEAIRLGYNALVVDLVVLLGFLFLLLNLLLDFAYPVIDARLRETAETAGQDDHPAWRDRLRDWARALKDGWAGTVDRLRHVTHRKKPAPSRQPRKQDSAATKDEGGAARSRFWMWRLLFRNGPLLIGLLLLIVMVVLVFWGNQMTINVPYQTHGVMMIDGKIAAPPFKPTQGKFPWGSDVVGRDIQALVLWGARQTLTLALFATVARLLLGTLLGAIAGWTQNSKFDRLVTGGIDVWAAFPVTIFAMLLIQAIGIQQGMWVFIVSLALVGWGEVAQFVRSKAIAIKPQPYIEAARSIGAHSGRLLSHHVFPNLLSSLVVLAALEMGSVLMLLAELGFLNIFLGGGFKAMIGEAGRMVPVIYYFSDVPEWGALLANIRDWWRSYPWMVWYAGAAFFLAIMTFNLLAEGLRRFLDESRVNVGKVINRYTALAAVAAVAIWVLWSTAPVSQYTDAALQFDAQPVTADVQHWRRVVAGNRHTWGQSCCAIPRAAHEGDRPAACRNRSGLHSRGSLPALSFDRNTRVGDSRSARQRRADAALSRGLCRIRGLCAGYVHHHRFCAGNLWRKCRLSRRAGIRANARYSGACNAR
jgi:peptide/nickel transport system permease protein